MSHRLYSTALTWNPMHGFAKMHGVLVALDRPPELPGMRLVAIDYVPEIGRQTIMPLGQRWRDMTAGEVAAADAVLLRLTA